MHLDGVARKWFLCLGAVAEWEDTPAVTPAPGVAAVQVVPGLRTRFLTEFQAQHYSRYQEARLRQRKQGIEELGIEYFYDVIDLCRKVDLGTAEEAKLDYLFRGLKPTLLQKIWIVSPKTSAEFLAALKLHIEAAELAIRPDWAISVLGTAKGGTPPRQDTKDELRELVLELKAELSELKRASKFSGLSGKRDGARSPQNSVSFASSNETYLQKGTVLGQIEVIDSSVVPIEQADQPRGASGESSTVLLTSERVASRTDPSRTDAVTRKVFRSQVSVDLPAVDAESLIDVPLYEADKEKTAFVAPDGLYQFLMMPFGLASAPGTFQRMMDLVLAGLTWSICLVYLDDIVIYALGIKLVKCKFGASEIKALDHVISGLDEKLKCVRSFLGLCSYYRRFIPQFPQSTKPLTDFFKKGGCFAWEAPQEASFFALKQALVQAVILAYHDFSRPFEIHPDACDYNLGALLLQRVDNVKRPLAYASRLLSKSESVYSITEKECLALLWAVKKFRSYIWGMETLVELCEELQCMFAALSVDLERKSALQCAQRTDWKMVFAEWEKGKPYPEYRLRDGLLCRAKVMEDGLFLRLCVPQSFRDECRECQSRKPVYHRPAGFMEIQRNERPFERLEMDISGPFPLSKGGNTNIVVAIDYFTKWAETKALPRAGATEVADFLVKCVLLRHDAPRQLKTNQGRCFMAEVTQKVLQAMETNFKPTTAYRPQANGLVERLNHTLANMISMYTLLSGPWKGYNEHATRCRGSASLCTQGKRFGKTKGAVGKSENSYIAGLGLTPLYAKPPQAIMSFDDGGLQNLKSYMWSGFSRSLIGEVIFSDSEWVVADLTFDQLKTMMKTLREWLEVKVDTMANHYAGPRDKFKLPLQQHVKGRALIELGKLWRCNQRSSDLKAAVNLQSARRKVSTQEDLKHVLGHLDKLSTETTSIVHALEVHASLINETLWETKAVVDAVGVAREMETHWIAITRTEDQAWLDQALNNFLVGIATMSM
ncbi:Uncharacterized protein APZ42_029928 [Daphnia magna]|uniref:RNA-directed DNA polymerase n=1 Tax=Daphnia magna TaxID=35525 RepID=A0A164P7M8_9CRUS|nr:Uncharacterized protein APZ42_029928 [Daphnia magna]